VLAIDGGGIRGVIPAAIIAAIEEQVGQPASKLFDLIAGTSTGGILALGLAKPGVDGRPFFTASDLMQLYERRGHEIFRKTVYRKVLGLGGLLRPRYTSDNLDGVLEEYFGDTRLSDALTELIIPSYDVEQRNPIFFTTYFARNRPGFDHPMKDVARATASAPTYFPATRRDLNGKYLALIDGGIFANNPTICAYAEAKWIWPNTAEEQFVFVSIGTGQHARPMFFDRVKNWGLLAWSTRILDVVLDSVSEAVHTQALYLLPTLLGPRTQSRRRYFRFQVNLEKEYGQMDNTDSENVKALRLTAERLVRDRRQDLLQLSALLSSDE
jgi:patatin-like phospholipase/acyl hydrolase